MIDFIVWVFTNIAMAPYNLAIALMSPGSWLDWSNNESLVRFIYYGASVEFFFVVFTAFLVITLIGAIWKRQMLWVMVRAFEAIANGVGRTVAWVGLIMVLQQVMIVFLQRIFQVPGLELGPLGISFTQDLSWFAEELKLYNAMIVCLCVSYTFVQGGHVRVDLFYSGMRHH
ncbi:MAG: C4-dicarboxylate ABC transporter permease, partial [Paracoccaceae bacterium]